MSDLMELEDPLYKTGVLDEGDLAFVQEVLRLCPDAFVGGSYIVKGDEAHDIDVVVPYRVWGALLVLLGQRVAQVPRRKVPAGVGLVEDDRLVACYRRGNVDLLVIADEFVPAYSKAVRAMRDHPKDYDTRDKRVALHIALADEVRAERGLPLESEIRARVGHGSGDY